jgi:hypothetical protein
MDDLLRLFEVDSRRVVDLTADTPPPSPPSQADSNAILIRAFEQKFGVRLDKSARSGADLMDLTASLSSHTMKAFHDGSVNSANVSQPDSRSMVSMMVTVGVVLRKENVKSAKSGRFFFKVSLGTPSDGPAIDVLFFDSCCSDYFHQCVPGKVVVLVKPNLLRQQNGLRTTFVVSEKCQVQIVADCKDYVECHYIVDSRLYAGVKNRVIKYCRTPFDKRQGQYCPLCAGLVQQLNDPNTLLGKRTRSCNQTTIARKQDRSNIKQDRSKSKRTQPRSTNAPFQPNFLMQSRQAQFLSFKVGNFPFTRAGDQALINNSILNPALRGSNERDRAVKARLPHQK